MVSFGRNFMIYIILSSAKRRMEDLMFASMSFM